MNIAALNHQLYKIYKDFWQTTYSKLPKDKGLSAPLFIKVQDDYNVYQHLFMMVGQQTRGWFDYKLNDADPASYLMTEYIKFHMGKDYAKSPFGNAAKSLNEKLSPAGYGYIWSNLIKVDQDKRCPDREIIDCICQSGLLQREIEILKPKAVVFFTGPYYDNIIETLFPGIRFETLEGKYLYRLVHPTLPFHCYRTYHPNALRFQRKTKDILERIISYLG